MDQFQRVINLIKQGLGGMSASQKMLIGSLAVIMVMTIFVFSQYTSSPTTRTLLSPDESAEAHQMAASYLQGKGIPFDQDEQGRPLVAPGQRRILLSQMAQEGKMPGNMRLTFDELIKSQSWMTTQAQNEQAQTVALQNTLAVLIQGFNGINRAEVIVDSPKARIGQPNRSPTAVATVFSDSGINQTTVDAIAHMIASSRAGLTPERVRVIDGTTNRQYRARTDDDFAASNYQEMQAKHESRTREMLLDHLSQYIPGVIVSVRAQVDATRRVQDRNAVLAENEGSLGLLRRETTGEANMTGATQGGEPGIRSNAMESIAGGSGRGEESTEVSGDTEFENQFGREVSRIVDNRGMAMKINAVVNIPRDYFVELYRAQQLAEGNAPEEGAEGDVGPSDADLLVVSGAEIDRIREEVMALVDSSAHDGGQEGDVLVSMVHTGPAVALGGGLGSGGGGGAGASLFGLPLGIASAGDLVRTAALGVLALVSLGLLAMTALKANKRENLPSAAELVGIPPELAQETEMMGEAYEADSALAGVELSDEELERRKRAEQIAEMVEENPEEAAGIIKRWMAQDEY